jgi:hypothetical protein
LVDAKQYPAAELRVLYHERWEIELGFGELKTDMLQRLEAIRSRSPDTVNQELWGLLLAYNLVRLEMERASPTRPASLPHASASSLPSASSSMSGAGRRSRPAPVQFLAISPICATRSNASARRRALREA